MSAAISGSKPQSGGDEGITDNESNFESASYYLGGDLATADRQDIGGALDDDDDINEIPVWVRGEARWIAGVTEHTTAADLVEALLMDDPSLADPAASGGGPGSSPLPASSSVLQQFVITERWRQMEQILEPKTKVWKIWRAWGEAQCEVRLRLRRIDRSGRVQTTTGEVAERTTTVQPKTITTQQDDSGRESPTAGSAIVRRRRHRASKGTAAWLTQAQTVHPKSSKSSIERLMSLILEQGETIQHQLTKLRDREIQISQLEEQKHRLREQEHGKNYLLETYLNGLHEAEPEEAEEKDLSSTTIHSDSGVNTEEAQSPNGGTSPTGALEGDPDMGHPTQHTKKKPHFEYSERENELLREHLKLKATPPVTEAAGECGHRDRQEVEDQIGVLEKIYAINKHLQREEELLVRLNAKIKRYESENPNLGEDEILDTLNRLNSEIEQRTREIEITNREIELSDQLLHKKAALLYGSLV